MGLHLEFRPQNFDEIIGNKSIIETIKNKLAKDKNGNHDFAHAILLEGPSGCGKTTLARIIAQELGCDLKSSDFQELDIAQLSGVDTAREIRSNMNFAPMESNCRIYLLDEFHMSSKAFQNAMLKALEDTPKHIYFILCTTDPQKIIKTIKTRCTKFKVKSLNEKEMTELINWVCNECSVDLDEEIIEEIIDVADGCPREALVILDSIIDLPSDKMLDAIQGQETEREVKELCQAMLKNKSWKQLSKILKDMKGIDAERARYAVIGWFAGVALNGGQNADRAALIFDCFRESMMYAGWPGLVFSTYNTTLD